MSTLSARYPNHHAHARLRFAGYMPLMAASFRPAAKLRRALHGLDAVCLFLVSHYLLRPLMALREYIRPRAAAGEFLAATAEPMTHDLMLGLFSIPGVRWSLALVMQGENREATRVLAWKVIRTEHEACMTEARRHIGEQRSAAIKRGSVLCNALCGLALAMGTGR